MSKFFNHTPQSSSSINQVENLAQEVNEAFLAIEDITFQDSTENASIASSIGSLDNSYIKEYLPSNGLIQNYQQHLYFPDNSQEASLDLIPSIASSSLSAVSISNLTDPSQTYSYKTSGILLTKNDFTFVNKKVVFGGPVGNNDLVITYKGYNVTDNSQGFDLKYNVLRITQVDGSLLKDFPVSNINGTYTISGYNFKNMCSQFVQNIINTSPEELLKYVAIYDSNSTRIEIINISINTSKITFQTNDNVTETVKVYVANSSLGSLIEHLYKLFYIHDHGTNGGSSISHGNLVSLYENTYNEDGSPKIQYQTSSKKNYDHPQYLNREGYIDDETVYNNSMLGDLLISSTDPSNRNNNVNDDSFRLVFGDYSSGHKAYYYHGDDCLLIDSMSKNGIKLSVAKNKKALSINNHSLIDVHNIAGQDYLQLSLQSTIDNEKDVGIFKIVRKKLNVDNTLSDDDSAKIQVYSGEYSLITIKDELNILNSGKISFGDPAYIEIVKENDGLHFKEIIEDGATSLGLGIYFDTNIYAAQAKITHLDADNIHLSENQKIVFGTNDHTQNYTQYINYNNNLLNIKTTGPVNFQNNGRLTGISLDGRQSIYTSTAQGSSVNDLLEATDLYVETKRDVYFVKNDYNFVQGSTNLQTIPRSNIYSGNSYSNTFTVVFEEDKTNGFVLNSNNKVFSQKDTQSNISTIIQANNGVVIANNYSLNTTTGIPNITYGKLKGFDFYAEGDKNSAAGFYGNVIIPVGNKLTVNGDTAFNGVIEFTNKVTFTNNTIFEGNATLDKATISEAEFESVTSNTSFTGSNTFNAKTTFVGDVEANKITATNLTVDNFTVNEIVNFKDKVTAADIEVTDELRFKSMLQTATTVTSTFIGPLELLSNLEISTNKYIVLGNKDIRGTRNTTGTYISDTEIKLGNNSSVKATKLFANKGLPTGGNSDVIGGYAFETNLGQSDGDTGLFCTNNSTGYSGDDLVFMIDGDVKGKITKTDINLKTDDLTGKGKALVTIDMLNTKFADVMSGILDKIYPIGSVYGNSADSRNPSDIFGFGVWRRYAIGRTMIGAEGTAASDKVDTNLDKPSDLNLSASGTKYGNYVHKLTSNELPITTNRYLRATMNTSGDLTIGNIDGNGNMRYSVWENGTNTGGDEPHNNTQPSIVTHIWERVG